MVRKAGQGELKVGPDLSGGYDLDGVGFVVELYWVYVVSKMVDTCFVLLVSLHLLYGLLIC